jgi:hypothetical protein
VDRSGGGHAVDQVVVVGAAVGRVAGAVKIAIPSQGKSTAGECAGTAESSTEGVQRGPYAGGGNSPVVRVKSTSLVKVWACEEMTIAAQKATSVVMRVAENRRL